MQTSYCPNSIAILCIYLIDEIKVLVLERNMLTSLKIDSQKKKKICIYLDISSNKICGFQISISSTSKFLMVEEEI